MTSAIASVTPAMVELIWMEIGYNPAVCRGIIMRGMLLSKT